MEPRAPERQWSPFTGEQERIEADSGYYDERPRDRRTARELKRGRPGLIALIAVIVQLIAIGGADNQWVIKHLTRYSGRHPFAFPGHLVHALTVYQWRFAPQPGDRANEPLAHVALVLTVLVLTALLVYLLCRGAVTFWRAFFGTWLAVVVATLAGMVVRNLISPPRYPSNFGPAAGAVFLGPNGSGVMAGAVLGVVCALFAAIVAVATRRSVPVDEPAYEPDRPEPAPYVPQPRERYVDRDPYRQAEPAQYYAGQYGGNGSPAATTPYLPTPYAAAPTVAAPVAAGRATEQRETEQRETEQLETEQRASEQPQPYTAADEQTSRIPQNDEGEATTQLPTVSEQATQVAPAREDTAQSAPVSEEPAPSSGEQPSNDAPTESFPRPPDDEDFGQHPDHHDFG